MKSSKSRMVAGCCGAALALGLGGGIASAQPNVDAIVNSTCTYPQVMAALNAQDPALANKLASDPMANGFVQQLVASPPDGRRQMVAQVQAIPAAAAYTGVINQVATSCNNF